MTNNPTEPIVIAASPAKPRKRRRGIAAIITILVLVVILVVAFFVGDSLARQYATGVIQKQMAEATGAPKDDVSVSLGQGSFLLQYLSGSIDHVAVKVDPVTVEGITGDLVIHATQVPTDLDKPVGTLRVGVTIPVSALSSKLADVSQLKSLGVKVTPSGDHLKIAGTLRVFGQAIPIGVTAKPKVTAGKPGLTFGSILLGKNSIPLSQFDTLVPGLAEQLKNGASLCIASSLPKEFTLTRIAVNGSSIDFALDGDGAKLNDASLSQKGRC